jgi:hypothetical protein
MLLSAALASAIRASSESRRAVLAAAFSGVPEEPPDAAMMNRASAIAAAEAYRIRLCSRPLLERFPAVPGPAATEPARIDAPYQILIRCSGGR